MSRKGRNNLSPPDPTGIQVYAENYGVIAQRYSDEFIEFVVRLRRLGMNDGWNAAWLNRAFSEQLRKPMTRGVVAGIVFRHENKGAINPATNTLYSGQRRYSKVGSDQVRRGDLPANMKITLPGPKDCVPYWCKHTSEAR